MGLLNRLFSRKREHHQSHSNPPELTKLRELDSFMASLLKKEQYIAVSDYRARLSESGQLEEWFRDLKEKGLLRTFCKSAGVSASEISAILKRIRRFPSLADTANERYVQMKMKSEKEYLDHILCDCGPEIMLDEDQRRAVLTDEDHCLIIAGAGAGKTTTIAAKVKYLTDRQGVDPDKVLIISFTNKAVNELKERINGQLRIKCPIVTFHSAGNSVLRIRAPGKPNIADDSMLYQTVKAYFQKNIFKNEAAAKDLLLFFALWFDPPFTRSPDNSFSDQIPAFGFPAIAGGSMRSREEAEIANYLYLNGFDYEYEPLYSRRILFNHIPYTPDFLVRQDGRSVYIEHFDIDEGGRNDRLTFDELQKFRKAIHSRICLHRQCGTALICIFSSYKDNRNIFQHLGEELERLGFHSRPRSGQKILKTLVGSGESRYLRKIVPLVCKFISNFKTGGYRAEDFGLMQRSASGCRSRLFLNICRECYLEYQRVLGETGAVDFQDMINESTRLLREAGGRQPDYKYIIVDEYQDISRQRADLILTLKAITRSKIIAVGDDWQSIFAFSGSDISLFTQFSEKTGYAKLLKIRHTYRNSQEIIDIAGSFIQKNQSQIKKDLISGKHIKDPVIIYTYETPQTENSGRTSRLRHTAARAVEAALGQIISCREKEKKAVSAPILLLGRFGFDGRRLVRSGAFEFIDESGKMRSVRYPGLDLTFMTVHASKGLGFDDVIVINGRNETYGFPSKIENDPVMSFVIKEDSSIEYAEERRLFYVAMTRTKNRVYFIAPEDNPSEFLLELKHDYKNVVLKGNWITDPDSPGSRRKTCPFCGFPLQVRTKTAFGLRLYVCSNETGLCNFMTNDYKAGCLSVIKCDRCDDGYLIIKQGRKKDSYFLGCTNYRRPGKSCSRTMSPKEFFKYMKIPVRKRRPSAKA